MVLSIIVTMPPSPAKRSASRSTRSSSEGSCSESATGSSVNEVSKLAVSSDEVSCGRKEGS